MTHAKPLHDAPAADRHLVVPPRFRPVIVTDRLVLRPLRPTDTASVAATLGDVAVARMLARVPHPYALADAEGFIRSATRMAAAGRSVISAVTRRGALVGVISLNALPARCRLGYWLARSEWGNGYGSEAVGAVVAYAFTVLNVRQIRAGVYVDNVASRRVLHRLGFRPLGARTSRSLARERPIDHIGTVLTRAHYFQGRR